MTCESAAYPKFDIDRIARPRRRGLEVSRQIPTSGPPRPVGVPSVEIPRDCEFAARSFIAAPRRWSRNPGIESRQLEGDSSWIFASWTDWATRSPSCPCTWRPPPPACSISSVSSTRGAAGTMDFVRAPNGCPGVSGSISAPRDRRSALLAPWGSYRGWPRRSLTVSCPTPRSVHSPVWLPRRRKSACWPWGAPALPSTSSVSYAAGGGWTARPRGERLPTSTPAAHCTCIRMQTAPWIVRGRLAPEVGALLLKALGAARDTLYQQARACQSDAGVTDVSAEPPTMAQQQADALALLAETALHHGIDPGTPAERYQVVVHVDASVLADADEAGQSVLEDGLRVSAERLNAWRAMRAGS